MQCNNVYLFIVTSSSNQRGFSFATMVIHILGLDPLTAGSNALPFDDYMLRYIYYIKETKHFI